MRILFLDIDGVLNRTRFRPAEPIDGLSHWIEAELAARMTRVVHAIDAEVVMCSSWRIGRTLEELCASLRTAGAAFDLRDSTPVLDDQPRWREIEAWMARHALPPSTIVIVDDMHDMGELAPRHVRTSPFTGFDEEAAAAVAALFQRDGLH